MVKSQELHSQFGYFERTSCAARRLLFSELQIRDPRHGCITISTNNMESTITDCYFQRSVSQALGLRMGLLAHSPGVALAFRILCTEHFAFIYS